MIILFGLLSPKNLVQKMLFIQSLESYIQLRVCVLEYSLAAITNMNVRICGALVQFGCYQHQHE